MNVGKYLCVPTFEHVCITKLFLVVNPYSLYSNEVLWGLSIDIGNILTGKALLPTLLSSNG
jgi:hypothetical protein